MKHIVISMLAHVDAGKTTMTESLLFQAGAIRKRGRVDHGDSFLDFDHQEPRPRHHDIFQTGLSQTW